MYKIKTAGMEIEVEHVNDLYDAIYDNFKDAIEEEYNLMIEECAEEPFTICGYRMDEAMALKQIDPIAYDEGVMNHYEFLISNAIHSLDSEQWAMIGYVSITEEEDEED